MKNSTKNHSFFDKGRKIKFPFTVTVVSKHKDFQVIAEKALRILPAKRIVCSGKWGNQRIIMKFFLKTGKINHYFNKELNGLNALIASEVRTPEIAFQGRVKSTNIKVIALKEIFPASDTMSIWNNIKEDSAYFDLQKLIIHEIAILHKAGLKQDDLHLGNFLISKKKIYTIDGDGVDIRGMGVPLSKESSLENLSIFLGQFYPKFDCLTKKSIEYYAECRNWTPDPKLFTILKPKIQKVRTVRLKKYSRKIFRECSEFVHQKTWKIEFVCNRKTFDSGFEKFIKDPNYFIDNGKVLKTKNSFTLIRINIDNTLYMVKRYTIKNNCHFIERYLKKTQARNSWRNAHLLNQMGIQLPLPILLMQERFGPFCLKAYFVVEYYPELNVSNFPYDIINSETDILDLVKNYSILFERLQNIKINQIIKLKI